MTDRLDSPETLARHLEVLVGLDPRLGDVAARAGSFDIRRSPGGFEGLARIVTGQQVSTASADAIWSRFALLPGALDPAGYLELSEEQVRGAGQSGGKYRALRGIAEAVVGGQFDFAPLADLPAEEAIAAMTRLKGVGPWTAEIYLMFSAAHPDIFPAGDVALQRAAQWAFGLDDKPPVKDLIDMARRWSPHRSTAALLLWRYYRAVRNKEGLSI
ncbi:DNA-3-methyladenine glycosylase [Devosia sp. ZB163]|uniref:DNA-3-methyladenine glycosylase family protein n=1 Tax=Devosia sp. ZB163 TaxID=3025938 RepID=UPI002361CEED|nr:DNA-3-methyladenine glycosylase [Devosia sp. ZB163]MDC9826461.1 DNA-3-methyladenine glycosylase [Devosia sp. ZB163]